MPSWISRATESHNAQLITTAAVSGFVVGSAILGFQKARRMTRVADLKASIPDLSDDHRASRLTEYGAASNVFAPSKEDERSMALAARARKGDYDDDVGTPKVHCLRKRLEQVTPWTHFECRNELFGEQTAAAQLAPLNGQQPDFVIDAIDNIDSKVALLAYCYMNNIKVISSMGAGCKSDPTRIFIGDISGSTDDPLSKSTRRKLRLKGVKDGIPVVYSTERPGPGKAELQPLSEEEFAKGNVGELGVLADFRVRILPVLGTMPAIFGLAVANHVILSIAGYPHEYLLSKSRDKMYDGILGALQGAEERLARAVFSEDPLGLKIPITQDDVGYLVEEVFNGRSIISGLSTRLALTRWNKPTQSFMDQSTPGQKSSNLQMKDLVLMTKEEVTKHEKEVLKGEKSLDEVYDAETIKRVNERMAEEEKFQRFR
ncbi:unnamed protein product [Alternaria alternata]